MFEKAQFLRTLPLSRLNATAAFKFGTSENESKIASLPGHNVMAAAAAEAATCFRPLLAGGRGRRRPLC